MSLSNAPRPPTRRTPRALVAALLLVGAVLAAALGNQILATTSSTAASATGAPGGREAGLGEPAGDVPAGVTDLADGRPTVANLDPELLDALRRAADAAAGDGIVLVINSGWRSRSEQEQLFREAISEHGSEAEAARWVAPADASAHVSGDAVDVGPEGAAGWLSANGARYGLCQIYRNEPWHYELRPDAADHGCPAMYADATDDPRMR